MDLAVLDVDGTLYDGTLGFSLLDALESMGAADAADVRDVRRTMRDHRDAGVAFRSTLGHACASYAHAVAGVPAALVVAASHRAWRTARRRLLASARPLVTALKRSPYTPVLMSGSPQEMIDRIGDELGVNHRFGLRLATQDGRRTREVLSAPALPEVKAELLRGLTHRLGADVSRSLAVGNSASDRELLGVVGLPVAFEPDAELRARALARGWHIADRHTVVPLVSALTEAVRPAFADHLDGHRAARPHVSASSSRKGELRAHSS